MSGPAHSYGDGFWTTESRSTNGALASSGAPDNLWESLTHVLHTYTKPYTKPNFLK